MTTDIELAQAGQDLAKVAPTLVAERAEPSMGAVETLPSESKQRVARTDLDEIRRARSSQRLHALLETNGFGAHAQHQ